MALRELARMNTELVRDLMVGGGDGQPNSSLPRASNHPSANNLFHKCHTFEVHTYKAPQWCEFCQQFLWGIAEQGMRCQSCGRDVHKRCYAAAMAEECMPTKKMVKQVFGVDLTTIAKIDGADIPIVVKECIEAIEARGLSDEGIYRLSGNATSIREIKAKYDCGEKVDFSKYVDSNVLTSVLKLFLQELPIPVISHDAYSEVMKATAHIQSSHDGDHSVLAASLLFLPKAHYHLLKHLAHHLHKVHANSAVNKMPSNNLARVFAPTLMRAPSSCDPGLVKVLTLQTVFVNCLIARAPVLF